LPYRRYARWARILHRERHDVDKRFGDEQVETRQAARAVTRLDHYARFD
jgi:hypothetical protein